MATSTAVAADAAPDRAIWDRDLNLMLNLRWGAAGILLSAFSLLLGGI